MKFAAIIPARSGSKRLPGKNLRTVGGVSLVERAVHSAWPCASVCVSTDSEEIADVARRAGATVLMRPAALADDLASTEAVIAHWWRSLPIAERPDAIVLLQPTSPLRTRRHVSDAMRLLDTSGADSVVSVRRGGTFAGRAYPRDGWIQLRPFRPIDHRPRTQDARAIVEENGAVYITRAASWVATQNRMGGTVAAFEMGALESIDVDTAEDLDLAEAAHAAIVRRCA